MKEDIKDSEEKPALLMFGDQSAFSYTFFNQHKHDIIVLKKIFITLYGASQPKSNGC